MSGVRWIILRSRFPLGAPGPELGELTAPDKTTAEAEGARLYGAPVVAQSVASRNVAKTEKLGAGYLVRRDPKPSDPDRYRVFARRKRLQHQAEQAKREQLPIDFSGRRGKATPSGQPDQGLPGSDPKP